MTAYDDAIERIGELEAKLDEERIELGVSDELRVIDGLTTAMLVALGKDDVKTMEDLAGCAADDLVGWTERKDGETKRFDGALSEFDVSRADAENMVMAARLARALESRLEGLFIEDQDLMSLAGLPFTRELSLTSGLCRRDAW